MRGAARALVQKKNGAKTKPVSFNIYLHIALERGRNSKWVTVSEDSRKKGKRKQCAPVQGKKEKLRVSVDRGQPTIHWTEMYSNKSAMKERAGG